MDVTLGDTVLSLNERIKEAHGLTRDAASIKLVELYDDRRVTFATFLRTTILDNHRWDHHLTGMHKPVIKLIVELEEE